eukprot:1986370-Rhodomonas_salina.2
MSGTDLGYDTTRPTVRGSMPLPPHVLAGAREGGRERFGPGIGREGLGGVQVGVGPGGEAASGLAQRRGEGHDLHGQAGGHAARSPGGHRRAGDKAGVSHRD